MEKNDSEFVTTVQSIIETEFRKFAEVVGEHIDEVRQDVQVLRGEVHEIKEEIQEMKLDIKILKRDVSGVKDEITDLHSDIAILFRKTRNIEKQLN